MQRKGWFKIPGVQDGDRTLEEQMQGLAGALAEASGKSVLDLGCAEGLIAREFARAGARAVHCIESVMGHLQVARSLCVNLPVTFQLADLQVVTEDAVRSGGRLNEYDLVLCLGIAHKMRAPLACIQFAARSSRDLVVIRLSARGDAERGILESKFFPNHRCDVNDAMHFEGFRLEATHPGPRGDERVQYWRRRRAVAMHERG